MFYFNHLTEKIFYKFFVIENIWSLTVRTFRSLKNVCNSLVFASMVNNLRKFVCVWLGRYCGDSTHKKIFVWDYDEESGKPSNRRLFLDTAPLFAGVPDGATIDNQGYLWVCFFDGQKLVRISPQGKPVCIIDMPVKRPTQPSWYGHNLDELLVTSCSLGVDVNQWPLSGHIFHLSPGAQGQLKAKYRYNPVKEDTHGCAYCNGPGTSGP